MPYMSVTLVFGKWQLRCLWGNWRSSIHLVSGRNSYLQMASPCFLLPLSTICNYNHYQITIKTHLTDLLYPKQLQRISRLSPTIRSSLLTQWNWSHSNHTSWKNENAHRYRLMHRLRRSITIWFDVFWGVARVSGWIGTLSFWINFSIFALPSPSIIHHTSYILVYS